MFFKKDDENYVYGIIGQNIKKYRKQKGWTQKKLAEEINYSTSFIANIESATHQTFSLGAIWRIAVVLGIDFYKLCVEEKSSQTKYVEYKCEKCNLRTKFPTQIITHYKEIYNIAGNNNLPTFNCTDCDGKLLPVNPMDI